jgi:hypothetical protein
MRTWSLNPESPLSLRIVADARVSTPDYVDDQIWELSLGGGDPASMAIQTTYGLRAMAMRIYPGFSMGGAVLSDPEQFYSQPLVEGFLPNYLKVSFSPFQDFLVKAEYWAVNSKNIGGKFDLQNLSGSPMDLQIRLFALLLPGEGGERMQAWEHMGSTCLAGQTDHLNPVIFIMGGAEVEQTVYPSLVLQRRLQPGEIKSVYWAHAGLKDRMSSFDAARATVARNWEAEIAHLELLNSTMLEIETGDQELDAALGFSQKVALGCIVGPTRSLPNASFIFSRIPDRGYSHLGDGSDHHWQWEGQTAIHTYILLQQILEVAPDIAKGILRNFCSIQKPDGMIDWKPGLGGQRNGALANPLLATMAWKIFEHNPDRVFLEDVFEALLEFYEFWFIEEHDQDQDGFPEWDHTLQMGFDDCPSFVLWQPWGQGLDITKAETPDLASCLYRESISLIRMADVLQVDEVKPKLNARAENLRKSVEGTWSEERALYQYRDRDTHATTKGEVLGSGQGEFTIRVERNFKEPVRLVFRSVGQEGQKRTAKAFIHGKGSRGRHRVEKIRGKDFQWFSSTGTATSNTTYVEIEWVEVKGLEEGCQTVVSIADYAREDVSLMLPLWAGIPGPERAKALLERTLLNPSRFWRPFGISSIPADDPSYAEIIESGSGDIVMYWNIMLAEGLLEYGFRKEAAGLIQNLLQAVLHALRRDKAFRESYHPDRPEGFGERDHVAGLMPITLYLKCLGIEIVQPYRFSLRGDNPFPWSVTVRWKGVEIRCHEDHKEVIFPTGEQVRVDGDEEKVVEFLRN